MEALGELHVEERLEGYGRLLSELVVRDVDHLARVTESEALGVKRSQYFCDLRVCQIVLVERELLDCLALLTFAFYARAKCIYQAIDHLIAKDFQSVPPDASLLGKGHYLGIVKRLEKSILVEFLVNQLLI